MPPNIPPTTIFLQEACLRHQFIRSKDTSNVVERPERLRAVNIGLAAAIARCEESISHLTSQSTTYGRAQPGAFTTEELTVALERLGIGSKTVYPSPQLPLHVVKSNATLNVLNHPAVKFVHGDIEKDVYLENLIKWTRESREKIATEGTEIPASLSQGDLYLCPTSMDAIQGALATVCEAVDAMVIDSRSPTQNPTDGQLKPSRSSFVAVRPPGHHCGEDTPSGFCFVNNVVVGAAHAYLKHNITRVIIFDIDLHHGNGTQSLIWQINEETYRQQLEQSSGAPPGKPGLQVFYGSTHDILSYPCEDGKPELVQAASVSIHGPHGQYVENIHLLPYTSEEHFFTELYEKRYSKLFERAMTFVQETTKERLNSDDVLVFISCGFDACEHEYESMSRHGRKVPVSFYHRFAQDARAFADKVANGRIISVLEGGYSDKALTSGTLAHISGLSGLPYTPEWWSEENLSILEKATKKRRGGRGSLNPHAPPQPWVDRTVEILGTISCNPLPVHPVVPPISMSLRDRSKRGTVTPPNEPAAVPPKAVVKKGSKPKSKGKAPALAKMGEIKTADSSADEQSTTDSQRRLPRVVLKLGSPPDQEPTSASEESP
ncbi:histone deacetylase domain-containing protein [Irpex rosettiformis]|uniref:Histone deacetylase domain-containing protein n=1 Tax=Irpex rosettiformis TaxID=378272 RepID=A0ACB8TYF2_9APHY|nr:histone deacetylase domain-containing protein [Irpex rosettiformis]